MLNYFDWVSAAGYAKELSSDAQKYFKNPKAEIIAQSIQNTAINDPLIKTAPNYLRTPSMNPYIRHFGAHLSVPNTMSDVDIIGKYGYGHSMFRHGYYDINNGGHNNEVKKVIFINSENHLYTKIINRMNDFKATMESVATGPFKNYPYADQISRWLCDTFMVISKDPNSDRFTSMGFFGDAMANGADINLDKVKALISKLNPEKDRVPKNIVAMLEYVKNSEFFRELSNTNKYLALSSTISQLWNKSAQDRSDLYTNPNGSFMRYLKNIADNRNSISPNSDAVFMHNITDLYYKNLNTADCNIYTTPKDEQKLSNICNKYLQSVNVKN